MDTLAFFSKILPDEGLVVLAEFRNGAMKRHHFIPNIELAAEKVQALDATGADVYHACASYKTDESRKQANVDKVKSLFVDIDIGKADGYQTRNEAKDAISTFCGKVGIHAPLIVSSGSGLHCYWLFDAAVSGDVWKTGAQLFRQVLDSQGFKHDPSRTTDQSSILRPVGSTWRKSGEKPVKLLVDSKTQPFGWYLEKFNAFAGQSAIPVLPISKKYIDIFPLEKLGKTAEYPPSSVIAVANECAQLARMRDLKGAVSEPEWHNAIGVIKHSSEGEDLAHEWSKGDPRYSYELTQTKIDRWEAGPTTCVTFERTNAHLCSGCKFKGKIKSPIVLGYSAQSEAPIELEQPESVSEEIIVYRDHWPKGFKFESGVLQVFVKDKDGVPEWKTFCDSLFQPISRLRNEDGTWSQRFEMHVSKGVKRQFDIPTKSLANAEILRTYLASYEVFIKPNLGNHAVSYVTAWITTFRELGIETQLYKHFGWNESKTAFLIGDNLVMPATEHKVSVNSDFVSGPSKRLVNSTTAGTKAEWVDTFDFIYNRPGAEVYQFTAMALLAAPMVGLINNEEWHGIPVALTGPSGIGKSAVGKAACSAFGPLSAFALEGANATANSMDPFIGVMHNLPCILDELTGREAEVLSSKLYAFASGEGKSRATISGKASDVLFKWDTIALITGNTNITETLKLLPKETSEAGQLRVFEVVLEDDLLKKVFAGVDGPELIMENLGKRNYGVVGREAIRYMMANKESLVADFHRVRNALGREAAGYQAKERFFIDLIATAYVGAKVYRTLGIIRFDIDAARDWALNHVKSLRDTRASNTYTAEDRLAQFLASLSGQILVTKSWGVHGSIEAANEAFPIKSEIKARMAIGSRVLLVSYKAFEDWCAKEKVQSLWLKNSLLAEGFIVSENGKATITKGTNIPSAQQRVIEFTYDKVQGTETLKDVTAKVVNIKGGK